MCAKDKAKAFMYVCFGVAALVIAFQVVADPVQGQAGDSAFVAFASDGNSRWALTADGDLYWRESTTPWSYMGNIPELAGVVPAQSESWGSLKAKSR